MVKHRQLAHQVGAFDDFFLESSVDLDLKMAFSAGTTFIFGSWICKADGNGKLQSRLLEEKEFDDKINPIKEKELTEKMAYLSTSEAIQKEEDKYETDTEKETKNEYNSEITLRAQGSCPVSFQDTTCIVKKYNPSCQLPGVKSNNPTIFGLCNSASSYQNHIRNRMSSTRRILLEGAQELLIMTVTPQDYVVHWPGSFFSERNQYNNYSKELPYQEGKELGKSSSETTNSSDEGTPKRRIKRSRQKYTVYMAEPSEQPLLAPQIPYIRSSDELEGNISPDEKSDSNESEE